MCIRDSFISFLLVSSALATVIPVYPCSGLAYSLKTEQLKSAYGKAYEKAKDQISDFIFKDMKLVFFDLFDSYFAITNIKGTYTIDAAFKDMKFKEKAVEITNKKDFFKGVFDVAYKVVVLGNEVVEGEAKITGLVSESVLNHTFTSSGVDVNMIKKAKVTFKIEADDSWFKVVTKSFGQLINDTFIDGVVEYFAKRVNANMKLYSNWFAITPFADKDVPITLYSELQKIMTPPENPPSLVHFCLKTNVGVLDRPYNKTLLKPVFLETMKEKEVARVCITDSGLLAIPEVRAKAREFIIIVDSKDIGFGPQVMDMISVVPKVQEIFKGNEEMDIGCRTNSNLDIVLIHQPLAKEVQIPFICSFSGKDSGYNILNIDIIARSNYDVNGDFDKGINIVIRDPKMYSYSYPVSYTHLTLPTTPYV
eukprot:TRINITY_DN12236_c0_g1_i15.p1 TRINITY_DN12236_c0_g1~~TRINITY_DN12236_c0_g1_i15.p1  ORF type:complete len:422 (+),score=126.96 TRINITY_DN12236_c0_g1_i15:75-1340(+)